MDEKTVVNISVILPTYNRGRILCDTLESLLSQDPQPLEIIVIDQTKNHDKVTSAYIDSLVKDKKIRYIYQENPHANVARNRGIRESKGEIVLFLDNDVIIIGSNLVGSHFLNYEDPTIAAVTGQIFKNNERPTDKLPAKYHRKYTGWIYFPSAFSKRMEVINLHGGNLSVRKDIIIEAGGFDENFVRTLFDDTDLSWRIHKLCLNRGLKTIHDPKASLIHLKEPTGSSRPGGINEYVIADSDAWMTWLYFFLINFGVLRAYREILIRFRGCVLRKKNILRPYYLWIAFLEFIIGVQKALRLIKRGRRLGFQQYGDPL